MNYNQGLRVTGLLCLLACCGASVSFAQQYPQARLTTIYPLGGQRGTAVDITSVVGADLDELSGLLFSHPGINAAPKVNMADGKPVPNQFTVTIGNDVPAGIYDVRALGFFGLSNPRTFVVGDRKELVEAEPNNSADKPQAIELNATVNGRSDAAADLDFYKFEGKAGQRVVLDCRAKRIDSKMVPVIELYTSAGRRLSFSHNQTRSDAVLDYKLPADGEYIIKVTDFIYGGGADYFYRLSVHTGPHIDLIIPASGVPGTTGQFTLYGRNLPGGQPSTIKLGNQVLDQLKVSIPIPTDNSQFQPGEQVTATESAQDGFAYSLTTPAGISNPVTIFFASAPVQVEAEPNDSPDKAQKIAVPAEVTGQFQVRGDADYYTFDATAGSSYWVEVFGQRGGAPVDPYFTIDLIKKNDKGEETVTRVTAQDDNATNVGGVGYPTTTDDPVFQLNIPADGTYRIAVRDRYGDARGDARLLYRLSIRKESPDFRLVALSTSAVTQQNNNPGTWELGLLRGDSTYATVMAFRRDGYTGPIEISAEGLPPGVTTPGAVISAGQNSATLLFYSTEQAADWAGFIRIVGKAKVENPAAVAEVTKREAALKAAQTAVTPTVKPAADAAAALAAATQKATAAKEALDKDAANAALVKAKADADAALAKATEAATKANDAKLAAEKGVTEATTALAAAQAEREKQAKIVSRDARSGTIVWGVAQGQQGVQPQSRLARSVAFSVKKETAPMQLLADLPTSRFEINQGRQVLVPLKVLKRAGFDNAITLAWQGTPANVQAEVKPIDKGKNDQVLRLFVANNVAPGAYTMLLQSTVQVSYTRNAEAVTRAKTEQDAATKTVTDVTEAAKKAAADKAAADKAATDGAAAVKAATDAKAAADKGVTAADAEAKKAAEKATAAKAEADKKPDDKGLADAKAAADKALAAAQDAAKKALEAQTEAGKKLTLATDAAKKATEAKAAADKADADAKAKVTAATAAKTAADKKVTDAMNTSKPANLNMVYPATAIVLTVKPAPFTLAAAVPNNGALKKGANLEVKVTVTRTNGFAGPVTLALPAQPGVTGVTAAEVQIPADKNEGTLVIQAAGDATVGALPNMVIQARGDFNGPAAVDVPVTVNVAQ